MRTSRELIAALRLDARQAVRSSARTPILALTALVILSLGIGATTTMFTLVDAVLLRPLPYPGASRLISFGSRMPAFKAFADKRMGLSDAQYFALKSSARTLDDIGAYDSGSQLVTLTVDGPAERAKSAYVTASVFGVLGLRPERGRVITPDDDRAGTKGQVAMLGHDLWARRYGSDPNVVGKMLTVDGQRVPIIGVLRAGAELPDRKVDVWLPLGANPGAPARNRHYLTTIAHQKDGLSFDGVARELATFTTRLPELFPSVYTEAFLKRSGYTMDVTPVRDELIGSSGRLLWMLLAAVALVLVIACANVANLFLVRAETRRRESAIRLALGARYRHFARQCLVEGVLITGVAALVGLLLAAFAIRLFVATTPWAIPRLSEIQLRPSSAVFALFVALTTGVAFGLLQLVGLSSSASALKEEGRGTTLSRRQKVVRAAFVVGQVAMAVVLLAGSGLMVRSVRDLGAVEAGFHSAGVLTVAVLLPESRFKNEDAASALWQSLTKQLAALPGVTHVAAAERVPLAEDQGCSGVFVENQPRSPNEQPPCVQAIPITPGYFETLNIPVRGTSFSWADNDAAASGVVVSRALADRLWPNQDPIGKGIKGNDDTPPFYRVVGVAGDVRGNGLDKPAIEAVYFPLISLPGAPLWGASRSMTLVIRTTREDPTLLAASVRRVLDGLAADAPITRVRTLNAIVAGAAARLRFVMLVLILAAAMALLLSGVGLYTVIAYVTGQRRGEIGIRMALGAPAGRIVRSVVTESVGLAAVGVAVGLAAAIAAMGLLRSLLFGVSPRDPAVLAIAAILLLAAALVAGFFPARKAARIPPAEALR